MSRVSKGSLKVVSRQFQGCFEGVLRVFQISFKVVSGKLHGCFMKVPSFEAVLRVI